MSGFLSGCGLRTCAGILAGHVAGRAEGRRGGPGGRLEHADGRVAGGRGRWLAGQAPAAGTAGWQACLVIQPAFFETGLEAGCMGRLAHKHAPGRAWRKWAGRSRWANYLSFATCISRFRRVFVNAWTCAQAVTRGVANSVRLLRIFSRIQKSLRSRWGLAPCNQTIASGFGAAEIKSGFDGF